MKTNLNDLTMVTHQMLPRLDSSVHLKMSYFTISPFPTMFLCDLYLNPFPNIKFQTLPNSERYNC